MPPDVCDAIETTVEDQVTESATEAAFEEKFNASMQRYYARCLPLKSASSERASRAETQNSDGRGRAVWRLADGTAHLHSDISLEAAISPAPQRPVRGQKA